MSVTNDFLELMRGKETENAKREEQVLQEDYNEFIQDLNRQMKSKRVPYAKFNYMTNVAKTVLSECVYDLYMKSLIIDEPWKYSNALHENVISTMNDIIGEARSISDLKSMFENASPYVKHAVILAETVACKKVNECGDEIEDKPFDDKVILNKDDQKIIKDFEKEEGINVYADDLQKRVVDVYKAEQKLGEDHKEKVQSLIEELSKSQNKTLEENAINVGLNMVSNIPKTLFNSILMCKSKNVIHESGSVDMLDNRDSQEEVIAETICTYTLLECVHSLGIKTFGDEERERMKYQFFTA
jgi:hypothetical protein